VVTSVAVRGGGVAVGCLVLAMALWASAFVGLKVAFAELPPLWVIFGRLALGSLVFLLAWRWRGRADYRAGDWKCLLGMAVFEPCLYFIFEANALQHTSAAQAGMITALLPLLVAAGAFLFLRERVGRATWAGFLVAMAGAVWLSLAGEADAHASAPLLGNFLEFLAMLSAAGYTLLVKHLSARYSAFLLTATQSFIGAAFFLPLAAWLEPGPGTPSATGLAAVAYLGLVVSVGAYGLYNFSITRLPASHASGFVNLIPVFTLVFAVLLLGERLNLPQLLAASLVFVGVMISQWGSNAAPPAGILD
jgi:drug/metabolite transporter (DMT)-like permease